MHKHSNTVTQHCSVPLETVGFLQQVSNLDIVLLHDELAYSSKIWRAIYVFRDCPDFCISQVECLPKTMMHSLA